MTPQPTSRTHAQAPLTWEWGMIAGCCVVFLLASEAYKAWLRPVVARSEKAALKRIHEARTGLVVSDGLEFVVVASGGKKREEELDAADEEVRVGVGWVVGGDLWVGLSESVCACICY